MSNELMVLEKIQSKLQGRREPEIFPLAALHRKELRALKKDSVGNLRHRLATIRSLKKEEYAKKYATDIKAELDKFSKDAIELNVDWNDRVVKLNKILDDRKQLELKYDMDMFFINSDYHSVGNLNVVKKDCRILKFDLLGKSKAILEKEFVKKYGRQFSSVETRITKLETAYEEAINFGDLEVVKKLYYMMKNADTFLDKVSAIEV